METSKKLSIEVVNSDDGFKNLKYKWAELLKLTGQHSPFILWTWMYTWWKVYKTKYTNLMILIFRHSDKDVAIIPFYIRKSTIFPHLKKVYFLGSGEPEHMEVCSEYLDLIVLSEYRIEVCKEILCYFSEKFRSWTTIEFSRILEDSILIKNCVPSIEDHGMSKRLNVCGYRYYINLPDTWDKYLSSLSRRSKRAIKVAKKRLHEAGKYEIGCVVDVKNLDKMLDELISLHSTRWSIKNKIGAFSSTEFISFHKKITKLLFNQNMLQLFYIQLDGKTISILYNICIGDTIYYYQSGIDLMKYKALSPGVLAHSEAIKNAIYRKYKVYDFMMGKIDSYKSTYNCEKKEMYNITVYNNSLYAKFLSTFMNIRN